MTTQYGELYVSFANPLGVGIASETVTMYIDGVRKPTGIGLRYIIGQNITIEIKDYYGQVLGSTQVVMSPTTFVDIIISLYEQIIYNNGTVAVIAQIERSDGQGASWNITVDALSSISFLTFRTLYNLTIIPLEAEARTEIGGEVFEVIYTTNHINSQQLGLRAITIVADTEATALIGGVSVSQLSEALDGEGINWDLLFTALITPLLTVLILGLLWYLASIGKLLFTKLVYGISLLFKERGFNPETSIKEVGQEQTIIDLIQKLDPEHREPVARIIYSSPQKIDLDTLDELNAYNGNGSGNGDHDGTIAPIPAKPKYKITPKSRSR